MFKVGDKVKLNDNVIRLSVDITDAEVEIIGITEEGLYELGIPKADIALHGDYLELVEDESEGFYNGKAVYIGSGLKDYLDTCFATGFTKGKVYVFENGYTVDDDEMKRPATSISMPVFGLSNNGKLEQWGFYPLAD